MNKGNLTELLAGLMPASDDRNMWGDRFALLLEHAADTDDLSLLRSGKAADEFEESFRRVINDFPGLELVKQPEGGFYAVMVEIAKLDRDVRSAVLKACAAYLRAK
ncbi:TPA: hypothetical protein NNM78_002240 [Pseudomonas aeruginosa]|nr:hypothetical protein [Pseudomonas aeruginosa]